MRGLQALTRGVAPLVLAVGATGLLSTAAWASPAGHQPEYYPGPPGPWEVSAEQCHFGGGHVVRDWGPYHHWVWRCAGGRFDGAFVD